jgi:hypothetical protein
MYLVPVMTLCVSPGPASEWDSPRLGRWTGALLLELHSTAPAESGRTRRGWASAIALSRSGRVRDKRETRTLPLDCRKVVLLIRRVPVVSRWFGLRAGAQFGFR